MNTARPLRVLLAAFAFCLLLAVPGRAAGPQRPDLGALFAAHKLDGCFVVETPQGLRRVNPARCAKAFRPASTF
jgi:hypothetical protein